MVALTLRGSASDPELLDLPWDRPLDAWPDRDFVRLPVGRHRHIVRFLNHDNQYFALKELPPRLAHREFRNLERLEEAGLPAVNLIGIATDRVDAEGEPLEAILVTRHLQYSLPYQHVFSDRSEDQIRDQLMDALALLLVRLHTAGFFWGDCSLSNVLFRRDAGALEAYVVDTETSEFHEELSDGQRRHDLALAEENIVGGIFDLQAQSRLSEDIDPADIVAMLVERYDRLFADLTEAEEVPTTELGRIQARLTRLNELGFDAEQYELRREDGVVRFRPTVVEEGHSRRRLERLTGIDAHENQARRLLNALTGYGAWLAQTEGENLPEAIMGFRWLTERWHPALERIPTDLRDKREDAELYHEILEHNWYLSERQGDEVSLFDAVDDYVETVLRPLPDEQHVLPD